MNELVLSQLGHTWIIDLDGTIVKHNGYKIDGDDSFLPGAEEFLSSIPKDDLVIFLTSRKTDYQKTTESFLKQHEVRYDYIIFNAPYGERIIVNDDKPSGLCVSKALSGKRDYFIFPKIRISSNL